MRKRLSTRKLFGKFLLVQMPVFALASVLGLTLLATLFAQDERNQLYARVGNLAARVGSMISPATVQAEARRMESYLGLLMADTAVRCAEVTENGRILAAAPHKIGCKGQDGYRDLRLPVYGQPGEILTVRFTDAELALVNAEKSRFTQLAIIISMFVATLASWFAFSMIVGRPVTDLLSAIRQSASRGGAAFVAFEPSDELGTVIGAFNDMQSRLAAEAGLNRRSLERLQQIYEATPGLMFSMSADGHITRVSGYWLEIMGYERDEVLGKTLKAFLHTPPDGTATDIAFHPGKVISQLSLCLETKTRQVIEVQLSIALQDGTPGNATEHLCVMTDVTGLNAANRKLRLQAVTDHLTGLPNRQAFVEYCEEATRDGKSGITLLFVDLDNFKWMNDTHGHDAGDMLLREAALRIRRAIGESDFLARLGGDEFAVVLRDAESLSDARAVANCILAAMLKPFHICQVTAHVGCSIGIAGPLSGHVELSELMRLADLAMYKSKQDGRSRVTVYSTDLEKASANRARGVARVRSALEQKRLRLFYQPIVCLDKLRACGAEALLRIEGEEAGLSTIDFINAAEESGLMTPVGDFVIAEGLRACRNLTSEDGASLKYVSLNLSPRQLETSFMAALLNRLRAQPGVARHLVLEITETALLNHDDRIDNFFADLRSLGTRIALDDFGTGYSSLSHLARYPVDLIKLDRGFIRHIDNPAMPGAQRNLALVKAASTLCRELKIQMVAEGIETDGELAAVKSLGIEYGQGYLFSGALPEAAFRAWAKAFGARIPGESRQRLTG